jgi:hypothetical protein
MSIDSSQNNTYKAKQYPSCDIYYRNTAMMSNVTFVGDINASVTTVFINESASVSTQFGAQGFDENDKPDDASLNAVTAAFAVAGIFCNLFVIIVLLGFTQVTKKVGIVN